MTQSRIITNLQQSIRDEHTAAANYRRRALTADPVTARLYRHVAHEEDIHSAEFGMRLKKVRKQNVS